MAIWALLMGSAVGMALGGPLGALAGAAVGAAVDRAIAVRAQNPERRQVAFTIAAIALAAKMAQADGHASDREAEAFERLFEVPAHERDNMRRFYALARQSVDGFEAYARQAASLLGSLEPGARLRAQGQVFKRLTGSFVGVLFQAKFSKRPAGLYG
jgi:DnaJ like chaperone protein